MTVAVPEYVIATVIAGMAITLIVLPKRRRMGYTLYALLAVFVMLQTIDYSRFHITAPTLDSVTVESIVPVVLIAGLIVLIVLVAGSERDAN